MPSILRHRLAFLSQIVPVRWRDLIFVWFDWVLYTAGPIPAELGQLAKLERLELNFNQLTGTPSLYPLTCLQYEDIGLHFSVKSYQYDSLTWFLYVLTGFCIPQVPSRLNWANWRICRYCIWKETNLPVLHPSPHDLPSVLRHRLAFLSQIVPVRWCDLVYVCVNWVLYTPGTVPAELGQLANLQQLDLSINQLTGTPFLSPLT